MAVALGRVVNFEMCHLRSLGRVANFKNEAFRNGGIYRIWFFGVFNMLHMLSYDHQGGCGECINVLDEYFPYVTEHAHVAHAVVWSSGGWGGVLTSLTSTSLTLWNTLLHKKKQVYKKDTLGPTAGHGVTMLPCCSLWLLRCHKRSGTEASRRGKNWKSECRLDIIRMIENHRFLMFIFSPLKSKIESPRRRNVNFHSWVTRLPI